MSHEKSISVEVDNKFVNLNVKVRGKFITEQEAVRRFRAGESKPLGGRSFSSMEEAVKAARMRSKRAGTSPRRNPFRELK